MLVQASLQQALQTKTCTKTKQKRHDEDFGVTYHAKWSESVINEYEKEFVVGLISRW